MLFSRTAHLLVDNDRDAVGRLYGAGLRVSFLLLAPLLWWIGLNSEAIVHVMFAHGEFTPDMTILVAGTLSGLIPSVVFVGVNRLMSNAFYAMDRVKVPALIMPCGMLIYVACAVPLSRAFGTVGLAVAASLSSLSVFSALTFVLSRELKNFRPGATLVPIGIYAALSGLIVLGVVELLRRMALAALPVAAASLPLAALAYFLLLALIRDATLLKLVQLLRSHRSDRRVIA